ncbi:hypothetical protein K1719_005315 [Acacia pycnantha]|nr:hypothetical protein K1719_005315 [Acacia pycnantha]
MQRIDMYAKMFSDACAMLLNPHTDAHQDPCPLPMNEGFDESQPRSFSEGQLTDNAETYTGVSTNQNHKDSDACSETLNKESVYGHDSTESNNPSLKHNTQETGVESGPCVYLWSPQVWLMHPSLYCKYMERYMCMPLEVDSTTSLSSPGPSYREVNGVVTPNLLDDIVKQIEYYFSSNNLIHNVNFQEHMKYCGGWVPLPFVASLPEVRELTLNVKVIEKALKTLSFMIEIKLSLNKPDSSLSSWNDGDANPCSWSGVTCNPTNTFITELNLFTSNIACLFPASILYNLTTLILYHNSINDAFPPKISLCRSLVHVVLALILLTGALPPTLSDLPNLRYLDFIGINFFGIILNS